MLNRANPRIGARSGHDLAMASQPITSFDETITASQVMAAQKSIAISGGGLSSRTVTPPEGSHPDRVTYSPQDNMTERPARSTKYIRSSSASPSSSVSVQFPRHSIDTIVPGADRRIYNGFPKPESLSRTLSRASSTSATSRVSMLSRNIDEPSTVVLPQLPSERSSPFSLQGISPRDSSDSSSHSAFICGPIERSLQSTFANIQNSEENLRFLNMVSDIKRWLPKAGPHEAAHYRSLIPPEERYLLEGSRLGPRIQAEVDELAGLERTLRRQTRALAAIKFNGRQTIPRNLARMFLLLNFAHQEITESEIAQICAIPELVTQINHTGRIKPGNESKFDFAAMQRIYPNLAFVERIEREAASPSSELKVSLDDLLGRKLRSVRPSGVEPAERPYGFSTQNGEFVAYERSATPTFSLSITP